MSELSSLKDFNTDIIQRQKWIKRMNVPSGQTTQMVVGSGDESDKEILEAAKTEYDEMGLKRVYYSAFTPIERTPLQKRDRTPLEREHRLYCVDFMVRKYGVGFDEFKNILIEGNLPEGDPKIHLARAKFDGPIDINDAPYEDLIRVPGIGPTSANRIMKLRSDNIRITKRSQLHCIGVVLKRADPFLEVGTSSQRTMIEFGG